MTKQPTQNIKKEIDMQIFSTNNEVLFENAECSTLKELIELAVRSRISLAGVNLSKMYLGGINFSHADLMYANLSASSCGAANFSGANLGCADLSGAYLGGANLSHASLSGAKLRGANLEGVNLRGANLRGANLEGTTLPSFSIVPEQGSFVAWKKVTRDGTAERIILKLRIPAKEKRASSLVGRKCRASAVKVLAAYEMNGKPVAKRTEVFRSAYSYMCNYSVGHITSADSFDDDIRVECTSGIHFFITRKEAEECSI